MKKPRLIEFKISDRQRQGNSGFSLFILIAYTGEHVRIRDSGMNRLVKEDYIPLNSSPLGDHHKLCLVLCSGQGLIRTALFGVNGKKGGALRALIQPFAFCRGDFYYDPVKKLWRLKEGECLEVRNSFHLHLNKYYAALFWADLITGSHGGGGSSDFFRLTLEFLRRLDSEDGSYCAVIFLGFLWRYLEFEGIQPELNSCSRCGRTAPVNRSLCYGSEGQIVCSHCRVGELPVLSREARSFLNFHGSDHGSEISLGFEGRQNLASYLMSICKPHFRMKLDRNALDIILK